MANEGTQPVHMDETALILVNSILKAESNLLINTELIKHMT